MAAIYSTAKQSKFIGAMNMMKPINLPPNLFLIRQLRVETVLKRILHNALQHGGAAFSTSRKKLGDECSSAIAPFSTLKCSITWSPLHLDHLLIALPSFFHELPTMWQAVPAFFPALDYPHQGIEPSMMMAVHWTRWAPTRTGRGLWQQCNVLWFGIEKYMTVSDTVSHC